MLDNTAIVFLSDAGNTHCVDATRGGFVFSSRRFELAYCLSIFYSLLAFVFLAAGFFGGAVLAAKRPISSVC